MIKTKVAFLEGRLLSSQSEQSEKFSKPIQKSHFCFDHVNRLIKIYSNKAGLHEHFNGVGFLSRFFFRQPIFFPF